MEDETSHISRLKSIIDFNVTPGLFIDMQIAEGELIYIENWTAKAFA